MSESDELISGLKADDSNGTHANIKQNSDEPKANGLSTVDSNAQHHERSSSTEKASLENQGLPGNQQLPASLENWGVPGNQQLPASLESQGVPGNLELPEESSSSENQSMVGKVPDTKDIIKVNPDVRVVPCLVINKSNSNSNDLGRSTEGLSGRRKQASPKKRNVLQENIVENVGIVNHEVGNSAAVKVEPTSTKEDSKPGDKSAAAISKGKVLSMMYDVEFPSDRAEKKMAKGSNAHANRQDIFQNGDATLDQASSGLKPSTKNSQPKKKASAPKKVSGPRKRASPKKVKAPRRRKSQQSPAKQKSQTPKKRKSQELEKTKSMQGETSELQDNVDETKKDRMTSEGEKESGSTNRPAMSLKIICTPFAQRITADSCGVENENLKATVNDKTSEEKTMPVTKVTPARRRGRPPKSAKSGKIAAANKARKSAAANKARKSAVANKAGKSTAENKAKKATKRKLSPIKSPEKGDCSLNPQEEVILDKHSRSARKKKKSVEFVLDFMNESEDDIGADSSEDEYIPPKEEKSWTEDDAEDDNNCSVSEDKANAEVKPKPKRKYTRRKPLAPRPAAKAKRTPKKQAGNKSPRKRSGKKKLQDEGGQDESQQDSSQDMPLLSPSKGKGAKRKKRRVRNLSPKKTYLDNIKEYTTGEDEFGDYTATDDEGEAKPKRRRKKRMHGSPYSVTGSWYIAQGYLFDITALLEKFEKVESWRFRAFAGCWQELKFSLVYRGRQNFKELLEFSEEIALLTKRFMMPPHSLKFRIGALYTIYGLYFKHPFRHFFKIRLMKQEYEQLMQVIKPFRTDPDNPDPAYIFRKLEVDGAISHVASSLEMCFDFYCAEREAVDIKYESQRLATTSNVISALPSEFMNDDDHLLQQYHNIKLSVMGDGEKPEKSVSFVEPQTVKEIKQQLVELKEETLDILRLKESMLAKKASTTSQDNQLSPIGARRAEIMAKAVKNDTSSEYLKKKCFREEGNSSPQKGKTVTPQKVPDLAPRRGRGRRPVIKPTQKFPREGQSNEDELALSYTDVKHFMMVPSQDALNTPLKSHGKLQKIVSPNSVGEGDVEDDDVDITGEEIDGDLMPVTDADSAEEISGSLSTAEESPSVKNPIACIEDLNVVPQVTPPPKRVRGRARRIALYKALEQQENANDLRDVQVLRQRMRAQQRVEKKEKARKARSVGSNAQSSLANKPSTSSMKNEFPMTGITDLPPEETSMILPSVKVEERLNQCFDQAELDETNVLSETFLDNLSGMSPGVNNSVEERFITLNIQFTGENINENLHFRISASHWNSIQNNQAKQDRLKSKLLGVILPDDVRRSIEQGCRVDIHISPVEDENSIVLQGKPSTVQSISQPNQSPAALQRPPQMNISSDSIPQLISPKKEDIINMTPRKSRRRAKGNGKEPVSSVIRELQEIWGPENEDDSYEIKPVGKGLDFISPESAKLNSRVDDLPCPVFEDVLDGRGILGNHEEVIGDGNSIGHVKSDIEIDDFEDESEPIILTPQRVGSAFTTRVSPQFPNSFVTSLSSNVPQNITVHNQSIETCPVTFASPTNLLDVRGITSPTIPAMPLYNRPNKVAISHPPGVMIQTPLSRPALFDSSSGMTYVTPSAVTSLYPVQHQPPYGHIREMQSIPRAPLPRNVHPLESQPSTSNQYVSPKFPGSISITHVSQGYAPKVSRPSGTRTPVALPHCPSSDSMEVLRPLPNTGGSKFVKVKINDKSVFVPADRVLTSATKVNYISEMRSGTGSSHLGTNNQELQQDVPVCVERLGQSSTRNFNHVESVSSVVDAPSIGSLVNGSSVTCVKKEPESVADSGYVSPARVSSEPIINMPASKPNGRVCSFLFSAKYKSLSGIMKDSTGGRATGTPVSSKKQNVPFLLKHSLIPKKKKF